ncbi:Bgt-51648 [Blumeria graminis f. sp. tritici]|uniref:Bgt-51648 n=1 Tax=Blumeria graminis f. sp. tritici TaxID=62690 RepID=A0A9X9QEJ0_BLUGR|nr:Bgt-51648 [Blumeria graminis f. sp. tritici]
MVSMRTWLSVMQNNASGPAVARTMEDMSQKLIQSIFWPANLPDITPIEAVWNKVKDYIQRHHPNLGCGKQRTSR